MILLIDNYDSFVYNLARYVTELGEEATVVRNDALTTADVVRWAPSHIIISPGPCTPAEAGVSVEVVRELADRIPILGVCLGHQCIGTAYGAHIIRAREPRHGKTSTIMHRGDGLFAGIPTPFMAARYHSLVVDPASVPDEVEVTATAEDGEIMALRHRTDPVWGIQFHPESILTDFGYHLLHRFLWPERAVDVLPVKADGGRVSLPD
jgi:anthranilate synthase/aminodeoxychorismate synthase-like glutamine amidotransferase